MRISRPIRRLIIRIRIRIRKRIHIRIHIFHRLRIRRRHSISNRTRSLIHNPRARTTARR